MPSTDMYNSSNSSCSRRFFQLQFAQAHNRTNGLGIEAGAFRLGIDFLQILADGGFVFFKLFDSLDEERNRSDEIPLDESGIRKLLTCGQEIGMAF